MQISRPQILKWELKCLFEDQIVLRHNPEEKQNPKNYIKMQIQCNGDLEF